MSLYHGMNGGLAFPSYYPNLQHSLQHYYKKSKLINHLSFSFVLNEQIGELYLGGIPLNKIVTRIHSHCKVIGLKGRWDCNISSITLHLKNKQSIFQLDDKSGYAYFDSISEFIKVPNAFFDVMVSFFDGIIKRKDCFIRGQDRHRRMLYCSSLYFIGKETIDVNIGNFKYSIELLRLFDCSEIDMCVLAIGKMIKTICLFLDYISFSYIIFFLIMRIN